MITFERLSNAVGEITRGTPESAGIDLTAGISDRMVLFPGDIKLIPTGYKINMHAGIECQIRPRSGLALKHGVTVLNSPGTIDSDYKEEVGVILINMGEKDIWIHPGDRIAQVVFANHLHPTGIPVRCESRDGGFGSTEKDKKVTNEIS